MSLANNEIQFSGKFAAVTKETADACGIFMSFCELEQKIAGKKRVHLVLLKWILKQEAKYFNRFITGFAADMKWVDQSFTMQQKPPEMFLKLRQQAQKTEKSSTFAEEDDFGFKLYQKTTDAIIAQ